MSSSHESQIARTMRINNEVEDLRALVQQNPSSLKFEEIEKESITLSFIVSSYALNDEKKWEITNKHTVQINFPPDYPDNPSFLIQITPVLYHPNVPFDGRWQMVIPHLVDCVYQLWEYYTYRKIDKTPGNVMNENALRRYEKGNYQQFPNNALEPILPHSRKALRLIDRQQNGMTSASPKAPKLAEAYPAQSLYTASSPQGSSGFRIKSAIRVTQPHEWPFPQENWRNRVINPFTEWQYTVPKSIGEHNKQLKVVILETALGAILQHSRGDIRNERFGILIGGFFSDPVTRESWVEIVAMLPAERVQANVASVEVSTEEINRLNARVDSILAESRETVRKIGWYHTHPNHGIFLSGTDQTNQRLCYGADWHVALVVDPIRRHYGAFYSADCLPLSEGILVLSKNEAIALETPSHRSWQELEKRSASAAREQSAVLLPPFTSPRYEQSPDSPVPSPHRTEEPGPKEALSVQHQSIPKRILQGLGKGLFYPPLLMILLVTLFLVTFFLTFNLFQSKVALAEEKSTSQQLQITQKNLNTQVAADQKELQALQQQLSNKTQLDKTQKQTLQERQQDLINQVKHSGLKAANPLLYRTILRTVTSIDSTSNDGRKATVLLKEVLSYKVVSNDTLKTIAQEFGVTLEALRSANSNVKPEQLQPDQTLIIPGIAQ